MDQIEILIPKTVIQEGSAFTATVEFRTRSTAAAATPTNVYYRVDCLTTSTELQALTSVAAASSVSVSITPTMNAIQSDANDYEMKQLTIVADDGLATQQRKTVVWRVANLYGSP